MRFSGKSCVVTGGAAGIGAGIVRRMAAEGAQVMIVDLNAEAAATVIAEVGADKVVFHRCDVSVREETEAMIAAAIARFGRVDILCNNAGIGCFSRITELDPDLWSRVLAVDLNAVFYACRAAIPHMVAAGGGAIINTASISGLHGDAGFSAYSAAKGAVVNFTRTLALDHAREGVRINAVCPGLIETSISPTEGDMSRVRAAWVETIPMGRIGQPSDVAGVVAFLASDDAAYVTGAMIVADGGVTAGTGQPNLQKLIDTVGVA